MWTRLSLLAPMAGPYALSRTNPLHLKLQPAVHSAGCCLCGHVHSGDDTAPGGWIYTLLMVWTCRSIRRPVGVQNGGNVKFQFFKRIKVFVPKNAGFSEQTCHFEVFVPVFGLFSEQIFTCLDITQAPRKVSRPARKTER